MTATDGIREFLGQTTMPAALVTELLTTAPDLWLSSAAPATLATDLALCHPPLAHGEVRASVSCHDGVWRLSVLAEDRPGLLADTASAVESEALSVMTGSVVTWTSLGLALHALSLEGPSPSLDDLHSVTARIRSLGAHSVGASRFDPRGEAVVSRIGEDLGDWTVTLTAPDQPGLLAAACRWFADNGANIRAASIKSAAGLAQDVFVVSGTPDLDRLADHLSRPVGRGRRSSMR